MFTRKWIRVNKTEYIGKLNALYVGDKNCLEELTTAYDEKDKEIERLKEENKILKESLGIKSPSKEMLEGKYWETKEIERLENIIKEVREYIEKHQCCDGKINVMTLTEYKELLEILKGE